LDTSQTFKAMLRFLYVVPPLRRWEPVYKYDQQQT